mmetsp:Transcript_104383/g.190641  ORF Transcript_104383/g.190641 Transcript_104383/m.190641 type:complete len:361 (-) Transcript_104383:135-1217(-)
MELFLSKGSLLALPTVLLLCLSSSSVTEPLTLKDVRHRARAADGATDPKVDLISTEPVSYLIRNLLNASEVEKLTEAASTRAEFSLLRYTKWHGIIAVEKSPELNSSEVLQSLNAKLAILAGIPETHLEEGYFNFYLEGHKLLTLHLDNYHAVIHPARIVSFLVYLVGEQDGLVGGGTVFPLADGKLQSGSRKPVLPLTKKQVPNWDEVLADDLEPGDDPQYGRFCGNTSSFTSAGSNLCAPVFREAQEHCSSGDGNGVMFRARKGDVVMFYHHSSGALTARSLHGGCDVRAGMKVVLSKSFRLGPKPWKDAEEFPKSFSVHQKQKEKAKQAEEAKKSESKKSRRKRRRKSEKRRKRRDL